MNDSCDNCSENSCETSTFMVEEKKLKEKIDENGIKWQKVYFGNGSHFENWHKQVLEIYGKENVQIEEVTAVGLECFENGIGFRIWTKANRS